VSADWIPDSPDELFRKIHSGEVIELGQNTNRLGPPEEVRRAVVRAALEAPYNVYAHPQGDRRLREGLLEYFELDDDFDAVITNGAIEGVHAVIRAFASNGVAVTPDPGYKTIDGMMMAEGVHVQEVDIYSEEFDYQMTVDAVMEEFDGNLRELDLIFVINPSNPLGSSMSERELRGLVELAQDADAFLVHDCTYRDFAPEQPVACEMDPERCVDLYSFSKTYGLAGLRIGAVIGERKLLEQVSKYKVSKLGINLIAQEAAITALKVRDRWIPRLLREVTRNQRLIKRECEGDGVKIPVYPSHANCLVIDFSEYGYIDSKTVVGKLYSEYGIFVRTGYYTSPRRGKGFIRVAFSAPREDIERFCEAFNEVMGELIKS